MINMNITFNRAIENFSNYLYKENKAESTAFAYIADLNLFNKFLHIKLNNKIRTLDKITLVEVEQYKYFLLDLVRSGEFKRTTASRKFNALKTFFAYLEKEFMIKNIVFGDDWGNKNNTRNFSQEGEDFLPTILEDEDLDMLFNTLYNSTDKNKFRDIAIFETLLGTGCRRSELLNLKWHHIKFYRSEIKIIRPKTTNANVVKMPKEMLDALQTYRNTLINEGEYVFQSRQSGQLSKSVFSTTIKKWVVKSGIQKGKSFEITAHTFRHTFITKCIRAGIPAEKIILYTGHKDKESLEIYKHLVAEDLADVANMISSGRKKYTDYTDNCVQGVVSC